MAERTGCCWYSCTIVCVKCVQFNAFLTFLLGSVMFGVAVLFVLVFPTDPVENNGNFWESYLGELINIQRVEIVLVISSLLVLGLGILGRKYTQETKRGIGCVYLIFLLLVFAFQAYILVGFVFFERANLVAVIDLLQERVDWTLDPDGYHELATAARRRTMENLWIGFANTVQDYQCTFPGGTSSDETSGAVTSRLLFAGPEVLELDEVEPLNGTNGTDPVNPNACVPSARNVNCQQGKTFGAYLASTCRSVPGTDSREFETECSNCISDFTDMWNITEKAAAFESDAGILFCRCLTTTLQGTASWARYVTFAGATFISIQALFILSVLWLLMCGGRPKEHKGFVDGPNSTMGTPDTGETSRSGKAAPRSAKALKGNEIEMRKMELLHPPSEDRNMPMSDVPSGVHRYASEASGASMDNYMLVEVMCPWDCEEGDWILVTGPDGRQAEVMVPRDVSPGTFFQCDI